MKNNILAELGMRIRQLRQKKGLTIEETAHLAGVHPNYLGDVERGKNNFSVGTLEKVAKVLEVNIFEIFSGKPTHPPTKSATENQLLSLFRNASRKGQDFIVQTAKFVINNQK